MNRIVCCMSFLELTSSDIANEALIVLCRHLFVNKNVLCFAIIKLCHRLTNSVLGIIWKMYLSDFKTFF